MKKKNENELTEREIEVLNLISKEMDDREIGKNLFISHHTAHTHRKHIYKKLNAQNALQAVLAGIKLKYIVLS